MSKTSPGGLARKSHSAAANVQRIPAPSRRSSLHKVLARISHFTPAPPPRTVRAGLDPTTSPPRPRRHRLAAWCQARHGIGVTDRGAVVGAAHGASQRAAGRRYLRRCHLRSLRYLRFQLLRCLTGGQSRRRAIPEARFGTANNAKNANMASLHAGKFLAWSRHATATPAIALRAAHTRYQSAAVGWR